MKTCPHCQVEKTDEGFHKNSSRKDGLAVWCNIAIGHLHDDPDVAQAAADYLNDWNSKKDGKDVKSS